MVILDTMFLRSLMIVSRVFLSAVLWRNCLATWRSSETSREGPRVVVVLSFLFMRCARMFGASRHQLMLSC